MWIHSESREFAFGTPAAAFLSLEILLENCSLFEDEKVRRTETCPFELWLGAPQRERGKAPLGRYLPLAFGVLFLCLRLNSQ